VNDSEIKLIEKEFEEFIATEKLKITEYLKDYDQIQI